MASVLVLPGIGDSGPDHWQSVWQRSGPGFVRVRQRDWDHPLREEWVQALEEHVARSGPQAVLVAHSLSCLVVAHWAAATRLAVRAAMLVAVPDPAGPAFPEEAKGFARLPLARLPFKSVVVASSDDPYGSLEHARMCAEAWGSSLVEAGPRGHLNAASGLGAWPEGRRILASLVGE